MRDIRTKVLLIEENRRDSGSVRESLVQASGGLFDLVHVKNFSEWQKHLDQKQWDVIILDLDLVDSNGFDIFRQIRRLAPEVPIVVLTLLDNEPIAARIMQEGAQDYVVKGQTEGHLLVRSVRYAIERQRLLTEIRSLSLVDELTGLYNRRGFLALAQQQMKIAIRMKKEIHLVYADLDGMKLINDTFGHSAGDQVLVEMSRVLQNIFRESDIIARIGGDEFVILAVNGGASAENIGQRLHEGLADHNRQSTRVYQLSVSIGAASYVPGSASTIEKLMDQADRKMYEEKTAKKNQVIYRNIVRMETKNTESVRSL